MGTLLHESRPSNGWRTIRKAYSRWVEEDGDQRAAAFAYYLLLSLLPMTLLLVAGGSLFIEREATVQSIVKLVKHYTPLTSEQERGAVTNIRDWLNARGKLSLAALPLLLWGSVKYLRTLIRTTNRVWHAQPYNWWRLPLKSLGLLGITASAVLIGILMPAMTGLAWEWIAPLLKFPQWAIALVFHLIPRFVLLYGLIMIYKLAPSRRVGFSEVWLGALSATAVLWLVERLFLFYASNLANIDALYGATGGIVAFLLWLYLSSCIGVFGICLCAARAEVSEQVNSQCENPHECMKP